MRIWQSFNTTGSYLWMLTTSDGDTVVKDTFMFLVTRIFYCYGEMTYRYNFIEDPHMVIDVRGGSADDGARLVLKRRKIRLNEDLSQQWDLVPAGEVRSERELLFESDAF